MNVSWCENTARCERRGTHHGLEDVVRAALRGLRAGGGRRAVVGARAVGRARRLGRGRQRPAGVRALCTNVTIALAKYGFIYLLRHV